MKNHLNTYFVFASTFALILLKSNTGYSQNLISNSSFEKVNTCPDKLGKLTDVSHNWLSINKGTPDIFTSCSSEVATSNNYFGQQVAYDGESYAGIYMYGPKNYREYLSTKLVSPLIKDKTYMINFWVSRADKSQFAVSNFDVLFSNEVPSGSESINLDVKTMSKKASPAVVRIPNRDVYTNSELWEEVYAYYVAKGNETYLTIGNLESDNETDKALVKLTENKSAYYYIDMISVVEAEPFEMDKPYVLEDITFAKGDYQIKDGRSLKRITSYLRANSNNKIYIYGHSDNAGSITYNQLLAEKRAKSVAEYLKLQGIDKSRIGWIGNGDKSLLTFNSNKFDAANNRKVEFILSKEYNLQAYNTFEE